MKAILLILSLNGDIVDSDRIENMFQCHKTGRIVTSYYKNQYTYRCINIEKGKENEFR